jgi:tight adherence protein B
MTTTAPAVAGLLIAVATALLVWAVAGAAAGSLSRYRQTVEDRTRYRLRELFLFMDPGRLFAFNAAVTIVAGCAAWLVSASILAGLVVASAASLLPRWMFRFMRRRRLARLQAQLPNALMVLAGNLRAGLSLAASIQQLVRESAPPLTQEFALLLREQRLGLALDDSLENLARRIPVPAVALCVAAMRVAADTGGSLAATLERLAQAIRSEQALLAKVRALTAQGVLQAWIVGGLPPILAAVLAQLDPEAVGLLWQSPSGHVVIGIIAVLETCGVLLIRRIVNIAV